MTLMKNGAFAAVAVAMLFGCGSPGAESIQRKSSAATVTPRPFDTVVECGTLGFGSEVTQFSIGLTNEPGSVPAYELQYPVALGGLGEATLVFSEGNSIVDFSVTGVRVLAAIVRSYDTGTNAYIYTAPGVTADAGLTAPAVSDPAEDDTRISRVKLCVVPAEDDGCTYTQGYWKTHSDQGPAAHPDATWNLLPGGLGEETMFFDSDLTWLEVLQTPPKGNAYFILAHQYIAARLNVLAGVTAPAQLATATTELTAIVGTTVPANKRALFVSLADALTAFNEGKTGPGHCDDEVVSAE